MPTKDGALSHTGGQTPPQEPGQPEIQPQQAEFLAKISHEIRTPLNAIMGYAEMLNRTSLDAKQQHYAGNIVKSSLTLVDILNTWLQQAKSPPGQLNTPTQPAAPAPVIEPPPPAHTTAQLKLLIVEDSSMIRDLFMDIFSEDQFTILTASTGAKALELAFAELPQLIFLDLHLPDTDGWQVAKSLRANAATAATHLIAMTGQFLKPEEYSAWFDEFLQKPFQLKLLRGMVDSWLHHLAENSSSAAAAPASAFESKERDAPQDLAQYLKPYWDMQMSKLLAAVSHTGSLFVTIELGKCLQAAGREHKCIPMERAGSELIHCASMPDIAGIEAIISQLIPLMQAAQP